MKKLLSRWQDRWAVTTLSIISVITHLHWLITFKVFTSGDWWYIGLQRYMDFRRFSPIWVTDGLGGTSAVPPFYFIRFLEGLTTFVGGGFILNEKLFFFIPITFGATLGTYVFLRQYYRSWLSFIGSIIFAFNTAMLFNYAGALTIAVAYALTPYTLYLFRQYLKHPKTLKLLILNGLMFALMAAYEQRIALLVIGVAGGLFIFNCIIAGSARVYAKSRIVPLIKLGGIVLALHAFWLIPYVVNARSGVTFSDLLSQRLFESFSDVQNALTLFHPFWTGERPATFVVQSIPVYVWIVPLMAFGGFLLRTKRNLLKQHREVAYWAFVALLGVFMVKQVNEPFVGTYPWIFTHVPGFSAFREASKFYLLIALAYAVLVPFCLMTLRQWTIERVTQKSVPKVVLGVGSAAVLFIFFLNMKPLVSGQLRTLYIPRHMPEDYKVLETFIAKQPDYFRTLWVPTNSRWGVQSNLHPSLRATQVDQGAWLSQLGAPQENVSQTTQRDKVTKLLDQTSSDTFLDRASIKYVIVPLRDTQNEDDFFRYYGDDRQYYIDHLDSLDYLKKVDIGVRDLAVYENQNYQPHIATFTDLQQFNLTKGVAVDPLYELITDELGQGFNFITPSKKTIPPKVPNHLIQDPYQNLSADNIAADSVSKTLDTGNNPMLYVQQSAKQLRYEVKNNSFSLYGANNDNHLHINGQPIGENMPEERLATASLKPSIVHYLAIGKTLAELSPKNATVQLGQVSEPLQLFNTRPNILQNPSFEAGPWQEKVDDCNAYDARPLIRMSQITSDNTDGKAALQLEADRHTACTTSQSMPNTSSQYLLQFDYKVIGGRTVGYEIAFDDPNHTTIKEDLSTNRQIWQTYQHIIDAPKEAKNFVIKLFGYADYRLQDHAITTYDNIRIQPMTTLASYKPSETPDYKKVSLPKNQSVEVSYKYDKADTPPQNVIQNGSFDQGLWQKSVSDCDAYDQRPILGMRSIGRGNGKALELSALRHVACTSQDNIPVVGNATYLFSFDYQSPNALAAHYLLEFNDINKTTREGRVPITSKDWQTFTTQLQTPLGATDMKLTLYAYSNTAAMKEFVNLYDNMSLIPIPSVANRYYVIDQQSPAAHPQALTFENKSATKKSVQVKGAKEPFFVSMSESFNPLWQLRLNNQHGLQALLPISSPGAIPNTQHFKLNDFQNGWYVDPTKLCGQSTACVQHADGSYDLDLVVEFTSQRWFYAGLLVSGVTLTSCLVYLSYTTMRSKKRHWSVP